MTGKVILGIYDSGLEESLETVGWQASEWYRRRSGPEIFLETVIEGDSGYYVNDNPVSFSQKHRMFAPRRVSRNLRGVRIINADSRLSSERPTDPDAFSAVRGD